ncbi:ImmA/IrrE family metallo-endopeptidase [Bradyrhizobium sp. NBAIM01]|uniref:helix-turn-helix domain-containing protein n=1 Tax=Bradyrhizobium sp. NBAIM01 TaxID=2793818 RepID=UPI001CD3261B|nr:ImmA/IrrE family metallo-endopeptidase [Bradyrhizobium sp. NBAIM01]MCA1516363.1 ImmA/IrrE family metallo-endopeptidase [Bradyrhizobium sp. NBAIM01]
MFNAERLKIARQRRKLSGKKLADLAGITPVTVSKIENGHQPESYVVERLSNALRYPREFFFLVSPDVLDADTVSFRSLKKMGAAERDASLAAGSLGIALYDWIDARFNLPRPDLIDLSKERTRPESAARLLRQHWSLGERPIGNVLKLLESKGVRILSLSENTSNVDAYSFWRNDRPYIFLNQEKTAERSVFDSAHELAHLVLHHHAGAKSDRDAESQADQFASAFLMPEADVLNAAAHISTANQIVAKKSRWKVSAMALAYRLHKLDVLSDWNHRSICIELGKMGYRSGEPLGIDRETSTVLAKVLTVLWGKRLTKRDIARDLAVPLEEIETLIFGLTDPAPIPARGGSLSLANK